MKKQMSTLKVSFRVRSSSFHRHNQSSQTSVMEYSKNETNFQNFSASNTERPSNGTMTNIVLNSRSILLISTYTVVCSFGIFGNGYVCQMIMRKRNKSQFMILLFSLAFADLLCSIMSPIPLLHSALFPKGKYHLGAYCYVARAINVTFLCASTWSLVVISMERYR